MDKLNSLEIFHCVIESGSYAEAAKTLGASPSTISKAISRLEASLNIKLIHRDSRKLSLTETGSVYFEKSKVLLQELSALEQNLTHDLAASTGKLKINLPVSYGRLYIIPLLEKFKRLHPHIDLEVSLNDRYVDIVSEGFDLGIRSGTLQDSNLVAQQLSPVDFLICASPKYWEKSQAGTIKSGEASKALAEDDYSQHPWLRFRYQQNGRPLDIMTAKGHYNPSSDIIVDDGEALADLCAQGLGITQLPHFIAKSYLDAGRLICVAPYYRAPKHGVWLVYPKHKHTPEKTRILIDFIKHNIQALNETPTRTWAETYTRSIN